MPENCVTQEVNVRIHPDNKFLSPVIITNLSICSSEFGDHEIKKKSNSTDHSTYMNIELLHTTNQF